MQTATENRTDRLRANEYLPMLNLSVTGPLSHGLFDSCWFPEWFLFVGVAQYVPPQHIHTPAFWSLPRRRDKMESRWNCHGDTLLSKPFWWLIVEVAQFAPPPPPHTQQNPVYTPAIWSLPRRRDNMESRWNCHGDTLISTPWWWPFAPRMISSCWDSWGRPGQSRSCPPTIPRLFIRWLLK